MAHSPPTLSVLVTTIGRDTLVRTLQSLSEQAWLEGDEVVLVCDGVPGSDKVRRLWEQYRLPGQFYVMEGGPHGDWGHTPRNAFMRHCKGDFLWHLDDDDYSCPGAAHEIRMTVQCNRDRLHLFRVVNRDRFTCWYDPDLPAEPGKMITAMCVHPNKPELFGRWTPRMGGDCDFILETVAKLGKPAIRCHPVIAALGVH